MRRRTVHAAFATAAIALAGFAASGYLELDRLARVERAVGLASAGAGDAGDGATGGAAADVASGSASDSASDAPRARLARALALTAGRDLDAAEPLLAGLAETHADEPVGRDARFALANAYLREGMRPEADPARARAWLELAKQRYRDALRIDPGDADARYNLERALRLAPEGDDVRLVDVDDPTKSVDVIFPDFAPTDLP